MDWPGHKRQRSTLKLYKNNRWSFPATALVDAVKHQGLGAHVLLDAWGKPFRLLEQDAKRQHQMGGTQFDYYELLSAGPDGAMWCVELAGNQIASITPDGKVTEHPIPTPNSRPIAVIPGPDRASMWFSEEAGDAMRYRLAVRRISVG